MKKKCFVVTGVMMALFMCAPVVNNPMLDNVVGVEQTYAAELPYSHRWETQSDGQWKYKLDAGGYATTAWVQDEVDQNWYLLGDNGIMRSGIFESYGKYYLLSEIHDGHFGHLVKNGEVYQGITIKADTSAEYEGALSAESIQALKAIGYKFESVVSVTGTQHVSDGQVTLDTSNNTINQTGNQDKSFQDLVNSWKISSYDDVLKSNGYDPNGNYQSGINRNDPDVKAADENFLKNR